MYSDLILAPPPVIVSPGLILITLSVFRYLDSLTNIPYQGICIATIFIFP